MSHMLYLCDHSQFGNVCVCQGSGAWCVRMHGFLTSLVCLCELTAAYFLLGSTMKSTRSLSSLHCSFTQPETPLAMFRSKAERGRNEDEERFAVRG